MFGGGCGGFPNGGCGGFPSGGKGSFNNLGGGCAGYGAGIPGNNPGNQFGAGGSDAMDWLCRMCRERNFSRRGDCFKCRMPKPADAELVQAPSMTAPANGSTLTGMVKSYNKKGFGFIMVFGHSTPDVFYTRENVSARLMHPDMPGEQVTFELFRDRGKLTARNIRPLGDEQSKGGNKGMVGAREAIGQSRMEEGQWKCPACQESNFARRMECFRCKIPKPEGSPGGGASGAGGAGFHDAPPRPPIIPQRKTSFSPHAGARAIKEAMKAEMAAKAATGGGGNGAKRSDSSSSSSGKEEAQAKKKKRERSSSSSSSKKKKKSKKKKRTRSSSSSRSRSSSSGVVVEKGGEDKLAAACSGNSDIDKAKAEALQQLTRLQSVEPKDVRMTEFRALLREWHPDKNLHRVELATAVFQFLQKGKALIHMGSS